jgi:AraC-like DNA-binding protein
MTYQHNLFDELKGIIGSEFLLDRWIHISEESTQELVIPDGCQDVIVTLNDNEIAHYFVSDLSNHAYTVKLNHGTHMMGFRLKPGTRVAQQQLTELISMHNAEGLWTAGSLDEFCKRPAAVSEALECLGSGITSVSEAAKQLGISARTLQRTIKQNTNVTPQFWLALSRVRRSCRSLHNFDNLADAAHAFGYADQSHMTREVNRWFGTTPSQISTDSDVYARLNDPGYG